MLDVSVKDWRRKLLQMAAESIKANYEANKDGNEESNDKIDAEVKLLMQRQDWLDGMKKVGKSYEFPYVKNTKTLTLIVTSGIPIYVFSYLNRKPGRFRQLKTLKILSSILLRYVMVSHGREIFNTDTQLQM